MLNKRDLLNKAKSRYTGTFKEDPVFDRIVRTMVGYLEETQDQTYSIVEQAFNIDKSSGYMLDLIGKIVGQSRILFSYDVEPKFGFFGHPLAQSFGTVNNQNVGGYWDSMSNNSKKFRVMLDDEYRKVIRARILSNVSGGTVDDLLRVVNILTDTESARVDVNGSGNALLVVEDKNLELLQYFFTRIGTPDALLPIPLGVSLQVEVL